MTLQWSSNVGAAHTSQGSPWGSEGAGGIVWTRAAIRLPNAGRRHEDSRLLLDPSRGPGPPGGGARAVAAGPQARLQEPPEGLPVPLAQAHRVPGRGALPSEERPPVVVEPREDHRDLDGGGLHPGEARPAGRPPGRQTVNRGPSSQAAALGSRETAASQNARSISMPPE